MKSIAVIPLRKGSKSIKYKNKKKLLGRPLYCWVLTEAILSNLDEIYLFTDDDDIVDFAKQNYSHHSKLKILKRSSKNAKDNSTTEETLLELVELIKHDYDILVLLQATSPLTQKKDINATINKIKHEKYDSALTVVNSKKFYWNSQSESLNYDYLNRLRRQDFQNDIYTENGAVYATTQQQFQFSKNRIGGNIALVDMPEDTLIEIDEPNDWIIVEKLLINRLSKFSQNPSKIKLLVLDIDGVLTNGKVSYDGKGEFSKEFSFRDGMGLALLQENGVDIIVITSENSEIVKQRLHKLKINHFSGIQDKFYILKNYLKSIKFSEVAYIGDDINDMACFCSVGWSMCPQDATMDIKNQADIIFNQYGGQHLVREAVEFIIKHNKKYI